MESSRKNPIDIEHITFQQSAVIEEIIVKLGNMLYESLIKADRYDEVAALSELIGEFTLLASIYGEQTGQVREDLGVSLNEAALLKLSAIKQNEDSSDLEWKVFADQTKNALNKLKKAIGQV
jgi:hypothetical protein